MSETSYESDMRLEQELRRESTWLNDPDWHYFNDPIRRKRRIRLQALVMQLCKEFIRQEGAMAWMDVTTALDEAKGALANDAIMVACVGQPAETD